MMTIGIKPVSYALISCGAATVFQSKVCEKIVEALGRNSCDKNVRQHIEIISQDCFYRELDDQQMQLAIKGEINFDHPGIV